MTIFLVTQSFIEEGDVDDGRTGFSLSNDGEGVRRAYVFADRAEAIGNFVFRERGREVDLTTANAVVLGHVIAHEAGHLLLPAHSHSMSGIMQPQFDLHAIDKALNGWLGFSADQRKRIGNVVRTLACS